MRSATTHHITAIAGDLMRNLTFYTGLLGLRFVKGIVNFDDPRTYFYFGDEVGRPGTIVTFLLWPGARRPTRGSAEVSDVSFGIAEPNGILFEIATDGPGFTIDETGDALGQSVKFLSVFKEMRAEIEQVLSPLETAAGK
jgi:glyoxalase family protein